MSGNLPIVKYGTSEWSAWYQHYRDTDKRKASVMKKYGKDPQGWTVPTLYPPVVGKAKEPQKHER